VKYAQSRGLPTTSAQAALGYLQQDLKGPYSGLAQQLRQSTDPGHAATLFSNIYERPGTPMLANRVSYAQQALGAKGGTALPTMPASAAGTGAMAGTGAVPVTKTGFNQALYQRDQARYAAGNYLAHATDPYAAGAPKTGLETSAASNPLITSGQLLTKAPDPTAAAYQTAQTTLQKLAGNSTTVQPHPAASGDQSLSVKGVAQFDGKPVAKWIAPILAYATQHGWQGTVNSGYRTLAQQTKIYDSGVRPAAVPGTSNHEMTAYPGGAVDVSNAQQLSQILLRSPYAKLLVYAGSKDPVHFSHPHNGSY
jgi:hypothetical protein